MRGKYKKKVVEYTVEYVKERLLSNIKIDTNGCWLWGGYAQGDGYGQTRIDNKPQLVHRLSYQVYKGPFYQWLFVLHTCDVRNCINPDHLFLGNHEINMADMASKGRASRISTGGGRRHTLSIEDRNAIAQKYEPRKYTLAMLAEEYNTTIRVIQHTLDTYQAG